MTMARSCAVRCEEISIINYSIESPLNAGRDGNRQAERKTAVSQVANSGTLGYRRVFRKLCHDLYRPEFRLSGCVPCIAREVFDSALDCAFIALCLLRWALVGCLARPQRS